MALVEATLKQNFVDELSLNDPAGYAADIVDFAKRFTTAFHSYAGSMMAGAGTPVSLDLSKAAMEPILAGIVSPGPDPAFATKMASSVEAYLAALAPPGSFIDPNPGGITTLLPAAASLAPALSAVFATPSSDGPARWGEVAAAINTYMISGHTVTFIYPPPSPPVLAPIA